MNQILWARRATDDFEGVKRSDLCHKKTIHVTMKKMGWKSDCQEAIEISRVQFIRT